MPRITVRSASNSPAGEVAAKFIAFGLLVPAIAWVASNYVATSPYIVGFAFRDLSALGVFALVGASVAKLYGGMYRSNS